MKLDKNGAIEVSKLCCSLFVFVFVFVDHHKIKIIYI